jgi:hypothetical protein
MQRARQQAAAAADVEYTGAGTEAGTAQQPDDAGSDLFDMLSIAGVVDPREIALVIGIDGHAAT